MKKIYIYLAICAALCACGENPTLDMAGMFSPQGPTIKTRFDHSMAYNDKVDEIYRFASMEIKAKAKALESIMSQDGHVDSKYKIN